MCHGPGWGTKVGWQVAVGEEDRGTNEEVVGQDGHADYGVQDEAEEVGVCCMRDAICDPGAVVVHFWDAAFPQLINTSYQWKRGKKIYLPHFLQ